MSHDLFPAKSSRFLWGKVFNRAISLLVVLSYINLTLAPAYGMLKQDESDHHAGRRSIINNGLMNLQSLEAGFNAFKKKYRNDSVQTDTAQDLVFNATQQATAFSTSSPETTKTDEKVTSQVVQNSDVTQAESEDDEYRMLLSQGSAGGLILNMAKNGKITVTGSVEDAQTSWKGEAREIFVTASVAQNTSSSTTTSSGMLGATSTKGSSITTPVFNQSVISAPTISVEGDAAGIEGSVIHGKVLENKTTKGLVVKDKRGVYEARYFVEIDNMFGSLEAGGTQGQEVSLPSTLAVERIETRNAPLKLVNVSLDKEYTVIVGDYEEVYEALKNWSSSYHSVSGIFDPKIAAAVSVAIAIALPYVMPNMGALVGGMAGSSLSSAGVGTLTAGAISSGIHVATNVLVNKAAMCLLQNGGDPFAAAQSLYESTTFRDVSVDFLQGFLLGTGSSLEGATFSQRLIENAVKSFTRAGLEIAVGGKDSREVLLGALQCVAVDTVGGYAAGKIGEAYKGENPTLNWWSHKGYHALLGAGIGAALGAISGKDIGKSAWSGGMSAAAAEIIGEFVQDHIFETAEELVKGAESEGRVLTREEFMSACKERARSSADIGRLGAGIVSLLADLDMEISLDVARNAVENNLIPGVIVGGLFLWEAYELIQTWRNEGPEAAAIRLGFTVGTAVVGGAAVKGMWKMGKIVAPTAKEALALYMAEHPVFAKLVEKGMALSSKGMEKFRHFDAKLEQKFFKYNPINGKKPQSGLQTQGPNSSSGMNDVTLETEKNTVTPNIFNKKVEWTAPNGTQQTYKVYQRNDIDWELMRTAGPLKYRGMTNEQAAKLGKAPQLSDGSLATLHHLNQNGKGNLAEASTRYHGVGKSGQNILHGIYGKNKPHPTNPVDRPKFDSDTASYWKWRIDNK